MSIEALVSVTYGARPAGSRHAAVADVLRVLMVLAEHAGADGAGACPSQATIGEVLRIDRRTVRHAIAALIAQGRIIKTADAVPRVRGDTYTVVCSSNPETVTNSGGDIPPTRAGISRNSGGNSGGDIPPTRAGISRNSGGNSGGELGRGTRAGYPRHEPEPEPENPPTPLSLEELTAAVLTDEELMCISNERTRAIIAEMTGRRNGENVHELVEPYEFAHLTPAVRWRRKRVG